MIQSDGSKNIKIMSTERELREKRDIDYKKLQKAKKKEKLLKELEEQKKQ